MRGISRSSFRATPDALHDWVTLVARFAILSLAAFLALPATAAKIAAVGDIACSPSDPSFNAGLGTATACRMKATSDLAVAGGYDAVLPLGDVQYEDGSFASFMASYDPSWGRVKGVTRPVPGNHEYVTPNGAGYYQYFGAAAGDPAKGWYSFDLGSWHLIVLNSNCDLIGGCGPGSPQEQWLRADLAAHPGVCTLAAWHHPRFSSGPHGDDAMTQAFWQALYEAHADVILVGHDHIYERFAPQGPSGLADPAHGLREFVVGTGGKILYATAPTHANREKLQNTDFGLLELNLRRTGYDWKWVGVPGGAFTDIGSGTCHRSASRFHPVTPCRAVDTRNPNGPFGGPALVANVNRAFSLAGLCGVPSDAESVAVNLSVVSPTRSGDLRAWESGGPLPVAQAISYTANRTRTNNAILPLAAGSLSVRPVQSSGTVHLVLDVVGYFQ